MLRPIMTAAMPVQVATFSGIVIVAPAFPLEALCFLVHDRDIHCAA